MNSLLAKIFVSHSMTRAIEEELTIKRKRDEQPEERLLVTYQNHLKMPCFSVFFALGDTPSALFQLNNDGTLELKKDSGFPGDLDYAEMMLRKALGLEI